MAHATLLRPLLALSLLLAAGCHTGMNDVGAGGSPGGGGDLGATPGGAQDIGYARELIEMGQVPPADVISVEGLLSEHDLPTLGPPCDSLLCSRPALAVAPSIETGETAWWLHLGLTSGLPADFERPPVDLVVAIDKSSSMSIDMIETTEAVARLIGKLGADDRLAVLTFDDTVSELHPLGPVEDAAALAAAVRAIPPVGGWNLDQAVARAYDIAAAAGGEGRLRRVMVLSCGYPALAADYSDSFSQMVHEGARQGIGLSFFGVLLGYSDQLGDLLGAAHGGSYYYLDSLARVVEVFDHDLDFMITPLAYDLRFALEVGKGFRIERVYGIPGDEAGAPSAELEVATAFLSRRRGGLVARLSRVGEDAASLGSVALEYRPEPALGYTAAEEQVAEIAAPDGDDPHYASPGVRKAAALVNQAEGMIRACAAYHAGDPASAADILDRLLELLRADAAALDDSDLAAEVALVEKLRDNVGAP